jgi:plastocyanin
MNTATTQTMLESTASPSRPFYTRLAALGFGLIALMALLYLGFALLGVHSDTAEVVFVSVILVIGLLIAGALLRFGAWAQVLAGLLALALFLLVVPFSIFDLQHPESAGDFVPIVLLIVGSVFGLVGSVVSLIQRWRHTLRVRATPAEALAVKAILAALALLALVSLGLTAVSRTSLSAESKANAVSVEITSFDFNPNRVVVKTGETVRLVVTNNDPTLHTFTLPKAGVDVSVPPGSEKLVEFKAPAPGEYRWYCIPHSDPGPNGRTGMVGLLVVQ